MRLAMVKVGLGGVAEFCSEVMALARCAAKKCDRQDFEHVQVACV
jgi:hypothetical protein